MNDSAECRLTVSVLSYAPVDQRPVRFGILIHDVANDELQIRIVEDLSFVHGSDRSIVANIAGMLATWATTLSPAEILLLLEQTLSTVVLISGRVPIEAPSAQACLEREFSKIMARPAKTIA